jgi:hypothetical protein
MTDNDSLHGLACPNCGGVLTIPEGQSIVHCPYCDLRSFVKGERGLRRYQAAQQVDREKATQALRKFLSGNWAIARDAGRRSQLSEALPVYLPFWTIWGRVAGWIFGEKRVGSGDNKRYEPREVRVVQEMTWNCAACDTGEFGVERAPESGLADASALQPFDADALHASGLVFEPVGLFDDARKQAVQDFEKEVRRKANLDRLAQVIIRIFRHKHGVVYYPLWVLRYLYRGRVFQVVVDGTSGKVLYGKAPGNTLYRAAALVAGMALGAFLAVDVSVFSLIFLQSDDGEGAGLIALLALVGGLALMAFAYRTFRYGEQYEFRKDGYRKQAGIGGTIDMIESLSSIRTKDLEKWVDQLS